MKTAKILEELQRLGYDVTLDGPDIKLRYPSGRAQPPEARALIEELRERKREAIEILKGADHKHEGPLPLPFLAPDGGLVIPFSADPRFFWWKGGQSVEETEREVKQWLM